MQNVWLFFDTLVDNEDEEKEEKVYRPNVDVSICHHCKTGFRDSNNIQCGATGMKSGFLIMKYILQL